MYKVLFVASEVHPLTKTGGLADVGASLPAALHSLGNDVRILMPGYRDAKAAAGALRPIAEFDIPRGGSATILEGTLPGSDIPVWLLDHPPAYDRAGHPYLDPQGQPWYDNAPRFALLCHAAVALASNDLAIEWRPDIVHCNDWQTGLVPALLSLRTPRPATLFTVHNLAYQGLFPADVHRALQLPASFWSPNTLEFYGQLSFIKGGLVFADRLTTVSPTYAREIQTAEFGGGLDGLLKHRADRLSGILNGIDTATWDPANDPYIAQRYDAQTLEHKKANKTALQRLCGLVVRDDVVLLGTVGRLVEQKGVDLILGAWPQFVNKPVQLVVLGSGEARFENELRRLRELYPAQVAVKIGYDEALAHYIEAGSDAFLMPSRFEPCGLNQMYSLRYGTVPVVRSVGGLADTVVDASPAHLASGRANGFCFAESTSAALTEAIERALELHRNKHAWRALMLTGMRLDFSWRKSATEYLDRYRLALADIGRR
jgi:starch synthase